MSPAVVNISAAPPKDSDEAEGGDNNALEGWLRRFFEDGQQPGEQGPVPPAPGGSLHASLGSGFIISDDGYILSLFCLPSALLKADSENVTIIDV